MFTNEVGGEGLDIGYEGGGKEMGRYYTGSGESSMKNYYSVPPPLREWTVLQT